MCSSDACSRTMVGTELIKEEDPTAAPPATAAATAEVPRHPSSSSPRRVAFDLATNSVITIEPTTLLDRQVRWYSKFEYKAFEAIIAKTAKHIRAEPPRPFSYTHVLEHVDHLCHQVVTTTTNDNNTDNETLAWRLPLQDRQALERLVARGAPVGLERWAVFKLEKHGENRKREILKLLQSTHGGGIMEENNDNMDERIIMECQRVSRPGRLFATVMAQALAAVVQNER